MSACTSTQTVYYMQGARKGRTIAALVKDYTPSHCFLMMNLTQLITAAFPLHVLFSEFFLVRGWPYFVVFKVMGCHWCNCWGVSNYYRASTRCTGGTRSSSPISHCSYLHHVNKRLWVTTSSIDFLLLARLWPQLSCLSEESHLSVFPECRYFRK